MVNVMDVLCLVNSIVRVYLSILNADLLITVVYNQRRNVGLSVALESFVLNVSELKVIAVDNRPGNVNILYHSFHNNMTMSILV